MRQCVDIATALAMATLVGCSAEGSKEPRGHFELFDVPVPVPPVPGMSDVGGTPSVGGTAGAAGAAGAEGGVGMDGAGMDAAGMSDAAGMDGAAAGDGGCTRVCAPGADGGDVPPPEDPAEGCLRPVQVSWSYRAGDELPLGQSRPGADVTLFVDFDGGSYSDESDGPASSHYDADEREAIEEAVEQTAGNYARWSINVTTDRSVFDSAGLRARMLILNAAGGSGKASTSGISTSSDATGYTGADTIFDPGSAEKCAYVLTHELGHNFGLRGTEVDYADSHPNETLGAFMGGRDGRFTGYRWKLLDSKGSSMQYPPDYFEEYAARIGGDQRAGPQGSVGDGEACISDGDCQSGHCQLCE